MKVYLFSVCSDDSDPFRLQLHPYDVYESLEDLKTHLNTFARFLGVNNTYAEHDTATGREIDVFTETENTVRLRGRIKEITYYPKKAEV
jgi:hypothetical protein